MVIIIAAITILIVLFFRGWHQIGEELDSTIRERKNEIK